MNKKNVTKVTVVGKRKCHKGVSIRVGLYVVTFTSSGGSERSMVVTANAKQAEKARREYEEWQEISGGWVDCGFRVVSVRNAQWVTK